MIATIRDSQNYVRAAELGVGIHEMKTYTVKEDVAQWEPLIDWLEPERALAEQPAPLQEQPAPEAVPTRPRNCWNRQATRPARTTRDSSWAQAPHRKTPAKPASVKVVSRSAIS